MPISRANTLERQFANQVFKTHSDISSSASGELASEHRAAKAPSDDIATARTARNGIAAISTLFSIYVLWGCRILYLSKTNSRHLIKVQLDETLIFSIAIALFFLALGTVQYFLQRGEIKKRLAAELEVRQLAYSDSLTGIANRRAIEGHLQKQLDCASLDKCGGALVILDFDGFKAINDSYGHDFGDEFLKIAASRMSQVVKHSGVVGRLGGDEFAIVLFDTNGREGNIEHKVGKPLMERLSEPVLIKGVSLTPVVSAGIAFIPEHGTQSEPLFRKADIALYRAKQKRGNCLLPFRPPMEAEFLRRQTLKDYLQRALESNELFLVYQPIYNVNVGELAGYEALLRWNHPQWGAISPSEFIPIAEETGLITSIGEWTLRRACHDAQQWPDQLYVAINVSPRQFEGTDLPETVEAILAETGLSPKQLTLEITESLELSGDETNILLLNRLHDLGVTIALDDFGMGYSALNYLQSFPFDKVKIDRYFIQQVGVSQRADDTLRATITLLKTLKYRMTIEGVETSNQLQWVAAIGCDEAQGFLLGRPKPLPVITSSSLDEVITS